MIRFILSAILILMTTPCLADVALNRKMGVQPVSAQFGWGVTVSSTAITINDAMVYGTSGSAVGYRFTAPVGQTSASLAAHVRMTAKTGAPTSITGYLYRGAQGSEDPDRPETGGSPVCTTSVVDADVVAAPDWLSFSAASCTIVQGQVYWFIVANTTGTPASNNISLLTRPQNFAIGSRMLAYSTTTGWSTDPTVQSASTEAPIVLKFSDGTLMGNPYVVATAHASNTNDRGCRWQYDEDMEIAGVLNPQTFIGTGDIKVYQGSTLLDTISYDRTLNQRAGVIYFTNVITFSGGTPYDVIIDPSGNNSSASMLTAGTAPPTDVSNAMYSQMWYVDGATPGSYTATQGATCGLVLIPNNIPAVAGSGSINTFNGNNSISGMTIN